MQNWPKSEYFEKSSEKSLKILRFSSKNRKYLGKIYQKIDKMIGYDDCELFKLANLMYHIAETTMHAFVPALEKCADNT